MRWFSDLMKTKTTAVGKPQPAPAPPPDPSLNPSIEDFRGETYDFFRKNIAPQQYQGYSINQRFASQNPLMKGYFQGADQYSSAGSPSGIMGANNFLGGFQTPQMGPMTAQQYQQATQARMNPYDDQVVSQAMADIEDQRQQAMVQADADRAKAKAFGSRGDLYRAETDKAYIDAKARTASALRQQGYRDALSSADAEAQQLRSLQLQASGMSADDAARAAQIQLAGGQALSADQLQRLQVQQAAGQQQYAMDQAKRDFAYGQFVDEQNFNNQKLQSYLATLSGSPIEPIAPQQVSQGSSGNPNAGILGGALAGAALGAQFGAGNPYAIAGGAVLGAIPGLL
jgi:hypothetical protein